MDAAKESNNRKRNKQYLPFLAVAAVTFSNGGDNIGVYTPMFAQYNSVSQVTTLIVVFHVNDCGMVHSSILSCKSPIGCF